MESKADVRWVASPDYNGKVLDAIKLDEKAIESILDKITYAPGATKEVQELAVQHQKNFLREKLRNNKISPNGIEELKMTISAQYEAAKVKPGKPVGIRCAEAFIATVMQSTLNTRHKAGAGIDVGFDAIREVIFLPVHRKKSMVFLHFKDKKSRAEILNLRANYVYKNVWHYVVDYQYGDAEEFEDEWWHPFQRILHGIDYDEYKNVPILRLYLDTVMMAEYQTSMYDITAAITRENCSECVKCLYGPVDSGILDIYPTDSALKTISNYGGDDNIKYLYYLDQCIRPALSNALTIVQGYQDIEAMYYSYTPVMSALLSFKYLYDYPRKDDSHFYYIEKRKDVFLFHGVKTEDVRDFLKALKGEIIEESNIHYIVKFEPETGGATPEDLYKEELKKQRAELKIKKSLSKNDKEVSEELEIENLNRHNYAILLSENLSTPLTFPDVDRTRTYCNNFHELTRVMGSEVAKTYHLYNTYQVMTATKTSTNARYFEFFSNVAFYRGTPTGITFTGISRQTAGWMSRGAIEQSGKIISEASLYDQKGESTTNISAALAVGRLAKIGTGEFTYGVNFNETDPSMILEEMKKCPTVGQKDQNISSDVKNFVKQMTRKNTANLVLDAAEGDTNITDDNMFDKKFQTPDFMNVRRTKETTIRKINNEEKVSLIKLKRIINNRDYVVKESKMTPSIITPDDIEKLKISPMMKTPQFVNVIMGIGVPFKTKVKISKPKWRAEQPVDMIVVSEFTQMMSKVNSHAFD